MTNSTAFAVRMISIPVVAGLLAALWCNAASAAEPTFHATPGANYGATVDGHKVIFATDRATGKATLGYWTADTCRSHTMTQAARKGEQVRICEPSKPALAFRTSSSKALVAKLPTNVHGSCRITERLVTGADGSQHIARHTVCQGS